VTAPDAARAKDAEMRQSIIAEWPDASDVDAWPDIADMPGRLLRVYDLLDAEVAVARARGATTAELAHMRQLRHAVQESRDALILMLRLSPLEKWRLLHPQRPDPLDGLVDCGGIDCKPTGFHGKADRDLHYKRWGFTDD
jgi:hypothetical protein